jgi:hypothetical protein
MSGMLIAGSHGVPTSAPLEDFVATDYQRYDGLDNPTGEPIPVGLGTSYGQSAKPGGSGDNHYLPVAIPGKVGSVGATPLPVADCVHKPESEMATAYATTLTTQFSGGPGAAAPGLDQSLYLDYVVNNPVAPDALAAIFA